MKQKYFYLTTKDNFNINESNESDEDTFTFGNKTFSLNKDDLNQSKSNEKKEKNFIGKKKKILNKNSFI